MPKAADIGSRRLISLAPTMWVQWLLGDPSLEVVDMLSADFQWVSRESDALLKVRSPVLGDFLVLNEIQLHYREQVPRRVRAYAGLAEERYSLPVVPVLINILEPRPGVTIATSYTAEFMGLQVRQDFRVLNLWEIDVQMVLDPPLAPLLPLAPVLQGGSEPKALQRALTVLRADETLSELEPLLAFFASFFLDTQLVQQIMRWDMAVLRESPWYAEILAEGRHEGLELGRHEMALQQLIGILNHRFGSVPEQLRQRLAGLPTPELVSLLMPALEAETLEDFRLHLPYNGPGQAN